LVWQAFLPGKTNAAVYTPSSTQFPAMDRMALSGVDEQVKKFAQVRSADEGVVRHTEAVAIGAENPCCWTQQVWTAMIKPTTDHSDSRDTAFSLVQGGSSYRIQQKLGLIPRRGLGISRRVIFFILLTWAPIMGWAIVNERVFAGVVAEPLLQHFSVHVRCLVAVLCPCLNVRRGRSCRRTVVTKTDGDRGKFGELWAPGGTCRITFPI